MKKGDISKFVEEAVLWRIFHQTVREAREAFAGVSPEQLRATIDEAVEDRPDHIRQFQLYLLRDRKLATNTVKQPMAAIQFFFARTVKRPHFRDAFPYPKSPRRLPAILSQ